MPVNAHRSFIGFAAVAGSILFSGAATVSLAADLPQGQGWSVSASDLNATGTTKTRMIVGAPLTGAMPVSSKGTAIIYERDSKGAWTKTDKLSPTKVAYGQFGSSVSMSLDGTRTVVGAPGDCLKTIPGNPIPQGSGCAYIYKYKTNKWALDLTVVGTNAGDALGRAVHITPDGSKVIVAEPGVDQGKGAVWVIDANKSNGSFLGHFRPDDPSIANFGSAIASSKNGEYLVVGASYSGSGMGAAWVFRADSEGRYSTAGIKLVGTGGVGAVQGQGSSVAMNWAGDTIVIGAPYDDGYKGSAFVFVRNADGAWEQKAQIKDANATSNSGFASSVALAADSSGTILASEPYSGNDQAGTQGQILTFKKAKSSWAYTLQSTTSSSQCKELGKSLALAPDASLLLAGAPGTMNTAGQYTGATCYFEKPKSAWKMKGKPIIAK